MWVVKLRVKRTRFSLLQPRGVLIVFQHPPNLKLLGGYYPNPREDDTSIITQTCVSRIKYSINLLSQITNLLFLVSSCESGTWLLDLKLLGFRFDTTSIAVNEWQINFVLYTPIHFVLYPPIHLYFSSFYSPWDLNCCCNSNLKLNKNKLIS